MTDRAQIELVQSDYSTEDLHAIAAGLIGTDTCKVCEVVAVVIVHEDDGEHAIRIIADGSGGAERAATVLRHAADHAHGGCAACRIANRRRARHARDQQGR